MLKELMILVAALTVTPAFAQANTPPVAVDASGLPVLVEEGGFFSSFSRLDAYDPDMTYKNQAYLYLINTMKKRMALDHFIRNPERTHLLSTAPYGIIKARFDEQFEGVSFYNIDKARFWLEESMLDYMMTQYRYRFIDGENRHTLMALEGVGDFSGYDLQKPLSIIHGRINRSGDSDKVKATYDGKTLQEMLAIDPLKLH